MVLGSKADDMPNASLVKKVAGGIVMPSMGNAFRFPGGWQTIPTAIATPFNVRDLNFTEATANAPCKGGQTYIAISRDPLHALSYYDTNLKTGVPQTYRYYAQGAGGDFSSPYSFSYKFGPSATVCQLDPLSFVANATYQSAPHGSEYYPFYIGNRTGFHLTTGSNGAAYGTAIYGQIHHGTTPQVNDRMQVYRWQVGRWINVATVGFVSDGTGTFATYWVEKTGYYAVEIHRTYEQETYMSLVFSGAGGIFVFRPLPESEDMGPIVDSIRVNALSLCVTPHPSILSSNGMLVGAQLPPDVPLEVVQNTGTNSGTAQPFDYLTDVSTMKTMPYSKGMYAFHQPTGLDNFNLQTMVEGSRYAVSSGEDFDVAAGAKPGNHPLGGWLIIAASIAGESATSYPAGILQFTVHYQVEFITESKWFLRLPPTMNEKDFESVRRIVMACEQFHENPTHWRELAASIANKSKALLRVAPSLATVLSALFPQLRIASGVVNAAKALGDAL